MTANDIQHVIEHLRELEEWVQGEGTGLLWIEETLWSIEPLQIAMSELRCWKGALDNRVLGRALQPEDVSS